MSAKELDDLLMARKLWTAKRREIANSIAKGGPSTRPLSEEFLTAQSMIEAIDHAIKDEESAGPSNLPNE